MSTAIDAELSPTDEIPDTGTIAYRHGDGGDPLMGEDITVVIPDVPPDVLAVIDNRARYLGISRAEYLKRLMIREREAVGDVTTEGLKRIAQSLATVADDESERGASK